MSRRRLRLAEERERMSLRAFARRSSFLYLPAVFIILAALDYPTAYVHGNKALFNNALVPMLIGMAAGASVFLALRRSGARGGMAASVMLVIVWTGVDATILLFMGYWSAIAYIAIVLLGLVLFRKRR